MLLMVMLCLAHKIQDRLGWLSRLNEFRFTEMLVGYSNALKNTGDGQQPALKRDIAIDINHVAPACFALSWRQ